MNFTDLADDPEDSQHTPAERMAAATRSTWVSVGVNLVLTAVQISIGIFSKSQALIADGIHSLSDLVSDFVVLFAGHHSKKDADEEHPYGHHRFETAASMVLGLLLLGGGPGHAVVGIFKIAIARHRGAGSHRGVVGGGWGIAYQGAAVQVHAVGRQAGQVQHAGGQCLARPI